MKERLDVLLVKRNLAASREKAKAIIMSGNVFVDGEPEACDWVKGTAKSYTFTTRIEGVEAGKYMWAVGIVDTAKQNEIGIHLAVKNNVTSAGWLKLFEVTAR